MNTGEVGVQAGALYLYTPDKQTLLFNMMRSHMQDLLAAWNAVPKLPEAADNLKNFSMFHIRYHLDRPDAVFISYMELRNLEPDNFSEIERLRHQYEAQLDQILTAGQHAGVFKVPDTRLATMAIIAMLTGVNTWYREGGRLSRERVERIYWNMVRRAVGS